MDPASFSLREASTLVSLRSRERLWTTREPI
jgi:hypothetical protein